MTSQDPEACPMPMSSDAPEDAALARVLARTASIAIVGASPNPERTSHQIARWLIRNTPYQIFLVNPVAGDADILGHGFFSDLDSLPVVPDMVNVFRRPEDVPPVATDAINAGAKTLWLQLGIRNEDAAQSARDAGLEVVQNRCIKVEYDRLRERIDLARAVQGDGA